MTIRLSPLRLLLFVAPLFMVAAALLLGASPWAPAQQYELSDALVLIGLVVMGYVVFLGSFSTAARGLLSGNFWFRGVPVRSSEGEATVAMFLFRYVALALLWLLGLSVLIGI